MLIIGSHVGFNKNSQLLGSVEESIKNGANTFMFYTGAPQNTLRYKISEELTDKAIDLMNKNNIDISKIIVHAPYIINLANPDEEKFNFSVSFLQEELKRCESLKVKYMVLHPGSHVGTGVELGMENIIKGLNKILGKTDVTILLETMAGKGSEVGTNIEEIKKIISGIEDKEHIGVCLDTCHLNDAGYNLIEFDKYLDTFDKEIGIDKIKCIHINDSKNIINSHKDRHENIGFGTLGFETLIKIIYNERLENIPKILETPYVDKEYSPYKCEIEMIKNKIFNERLIEDIKSLQ